MKFSPHMTVSEILDVCPAAIQVFKARGLGRFESPDLRSSLGRILRLRSALKMLEADEESFISALNKVAAEQESDFSEDYSAQKSLTVLGFMPCGMKMPFKRRFDEFAASMPPSVNLKFLIEGNVNHEFSYYPYIDNLEDASELPDVIVSADINSFFHHRFVKKFINSGIFRTADTGAALNKDFAGTGYIDPLGHYSMLSANILVIVVNKRKLGKLPVPRKWADLLEPIYKKSLVMRGQDGFFCSGVILPFYASYGVEGVKAMTRTVSAGLHPSEMVEAINKNSPDAAPFYIMPLFFAMRLANPESYQIVYPEEGAVISPVIMLLKKELSAESASVAEFIASAEMGQFCADAGFPSVRADVDNHLPEGCRLSWMGWDFLRGEDPSLVKEKIENIFTENFQGVTSSI